MLGVIAGVGVWYGVHAYERRALRSEFDLAVTARAGALEREVSVQLEAVRSHGSTAPATAAKASVRTAVWAASAAVPC